MKKIILTLIFLFFSLNAFAKEDKAEVIILGCIHERHEKAEVYPIELLRDIVHRLNPDVILIEISKSQRYYDKNGEYQKWFKDYIARGNNELSVAHDISLENNIPLIPMDAFGIKMWNYRHTNRTLEKVYWERLSSAFNKSEPFLTSLFQTFNEITKIKGVYHNKRPDIINSEFYDNIVALHKKMLYEIISEIALENDYFKDLHEYINTSRNHFKKRNETMSENIILTAQKYKGKRILVLVGAEHRFYLKHKVSKESSIDLKEYWETKEYERTGT